MESKTFSPSLPPENAVNQRKRHAVFSALRKDWQLYSLLVIPVIYLLIFKYGPMIGNVIAFRRFVPGGSIFGEKWVGLHYFRMFIEDPTFWRVFSNSLILGGLTLLCTFPVPIIFALLLKRNLSEYDAFINELKGQGLDSYLELTNNTYKKYKEKK
ncbi:MULTISPECIES: hypothetical protein [Paenibacillus]|uniref:Sugar ABC transporter permease n=1 Tax=Paenibacillus albilobatus TaxID=2716884 RepID=A0A919XQT1_9BACL|nr:MULTISPECIES: hypothetical protein [Paenibacillus]GIO34548.1 hypothetical protein J2TS6_56890 [Paenibacillus albilobatus]